MRFFNAMVVTALVSACSSGGEGSGGTKSNGNPGTEGNIPSAGSQDTRQANAPAPSSDGQPQAMTVEGRLGAGAECRVVTTPDGRTFALTGGDEGIANGAYVRVSGALAESSFCQQGQGTIEVREMAPTDPPARDRDPARAGGIPVTADYVRGSWVAKGGDCRKPNFAVTANSRGMSIIETRINGYPETGVVDVGPTPALQWDEPLPTLPIEARGPDGLAVMPPSNGETVTLAGHRITGDGVVFIKCA